MRRLIVDARVRIIVQYPPDRAIAMKISKVVFIFTLVVCVASWEQRQHFKAHAEESPVANGPLLPVVPAKWKLAYSGHPGGPEGRRFLTTVVALDQDGGLSKTTYRGRSPQAEQTTTTDQLSVKEKEEYLLRFGKMLESFSFQPAMAGMFDSDRVTFSLQVGRRRMEVEINEFSGETNLEFRSRVSRFLPDQEIIPGARIGGQPDPMKRLGAVADPWKVEATIGSGSKRLYKIDIQSRTLRQTESERRATNRQTQKDDALPCKLRLQQFVPGTETALADHTTDLSDELEKTILDRTLRSLNAFTFTEQIDEAAGNVDVSLTLISKCPNGETARELKISESGLSGAQFDKSFAPELIRLVNAQVPDSSKIRLD